MPLLLLAAFFLSGAAALIYELVWFYLVELIVGASSLSVAALLASFMGGMALGSLVVPSVIPARWHPLRVLVGIELVMCAIGLSMPTLLPLIGDGYTAFAEAGTSSILVRGAVAMVVLLPPTFLMGATLPVAARWPPIAAQAGRVGWLYMSNTAGGAGGTVLAGFYLLRVFDTVTASMVAATLNLLAAAVCWRLARSSGSAPHDVTTVDSSPAREDSRVAWTPAARICLVAALSGFTALGAEVVWTRQMSLLFGASVYTFSVILATYLIGLGLGGAAGSALARRSRDPAIALGICQALLMPAIAWTAWAIVNLLPPWQPTATSLAWVRASPALLFGFDAVRTALAVGPATLLWGASFPLAVAAGDRTSRASVATLNAVNTAGALVGALGLTLLGIPLLGSAVSQRLLIVCAAFSAGLLVFRTPHAWRAAGLVGIGACAALLAVPAVPGALIAYGRSVNSWNSVARFLYVQEGATASVAVTEDAQGIRQFHIAGKVEASDMDIDMRLERMLGHVPALVHGSPRRVLVVGNGAGVTAGALAAYPDVERIVICEIERVVPESARQYFAHANGGVLDDARVELIYDDGRHYLETTDETFDLITTDPIHPWVQGAATLYSLEYLELVRSRLAPGGVVTQWVPLYETDEASVKSQLATFARVFPEMTLWNPDLLEEGYDLVVLGRTQSTPISEDVLDQRLQQRPTVLRSLAQVSLPSAGALLSTYAGRGTDLSSWLADGEINRERHLRLQYLAGMAANRENRVGIFQMIVQHRKYPADLFRLSAETEMKLRGWY